MVALNAQNANKKTKMIFPVNSGFVISEILKKNQVNETKEQVLEKIKTGKETTGGKIAKIVKQFAEETISIEEFPYEIQKALDISLEKAKKIALELYKKVIALAEKLAPETRIKKNPGSTTKIKPAPKKFAETLEKPRRTETARPIRPTRTQQPRKQTGKDRYREAIE